MNFVINKKYFTTIILLISCAAFAQNSFDEQFKFAKKLYSDEDYFDTVTELKRLLLSSNTAKTRSPRLSRCSTSTCPSQTTR